MVTPPQLHMACDLLECQTVRAGRGVGQSWEGWEDAIKRQLDQGTGEHKVIWPAASTYTTDQALGSQWSLLEQDQSQLLCCWFLRIWPEVLLESKVDLSKHVQRHGTKWNRHWTHEVSCVQKPSSSSEILSKASDLLE